MKTDIYRQLQRHLDNIRDIIEKSSGPYAVMNCVCRQARGKMGEPCKQTDIMQICFTLGEAARYMPDGCPCVSKYSHGSITKSLHRLWQLPECM